MNDPVNNAGLFLIKIVFDLYIFIVMLRIILQWVRADFANPIFELVAKLTNPPLKQIRRLIPTVHGYDIAAVALLLLLEIIKIAILVWLQDVTPTFLGLIVLAFAELFGQLLNFFFFALIAMAVLSWLSPLAHGPLVEVLYRLCEPLLRPVRRVLPPIVGLDLSPIPVIIILKLLELLIVQPLMQIGYVALAG